MIKRTAIAAGVFAISALAAAGMTFAQTNTPTTSPTTTVTASPTTPTTAPSGTMPGGAPATGRGL